MEYLDRIYLNGYVPNLQGGGQVVRFLAHRGFPIRSPAVVTDRVALPGGGALLADTNQIR